MQFVDDGVRNAQRVIANTIERQVILLEVEHKRGSDNEDSAPHFGTQSLVHALNGLFVNANARLLLLLVVEHQHARALEISVELDTANLVGFVAALKELQRKEAPRIPSKLSV